MATRPFSLRLSSSVNEQRRDWSRLASVCSSVRGASDVVCGRACQIGISGRLGCGLGGWDWAGGRGWGGEGGGMGGRDGGMAGGVGVDAVAATGRPQQQQGSRRSSSSSSSSTGGDRLQGRHRCRAGGSCSPNTKGRSPFLPSLLFPSSTHPLTHTSKALEYAHSLFPSCLEFDRPSLSTYKHPPRSTPHTTHTPSP